MDSLVSLLAIVVGLINRHVHWYFVWFSAFMVLLIFYLFAVHLLLIIFTLYDYLFNKRILPRLEVRK